MKNKILSVVLPVCGHNSTLLWACGQLVKEFKFNNSMSPECWRSGIVTLFPAHTGVKNAAAHPTAARGESYFNMAMEAAVYSLLSVSYTQSPAEPSEDCSAVEINFTTNTMRSV